MNNIENDEFYEQHPGISRMFRNVKLNQLLDEVRKWKQEGKSKEEVLAMIDRRVLVDEDIEKLYQESDDISDNEQSIQEQKDYFEEESGTEKIEDTEVEDNNQSNTKDFTYLRDDELIDFENQPFVTNIEEDNRELTNSIKLNGIIEPIIVRPYQGKYQILSGHRRRKCGRDTGLEEFPCVIKEKTDSEAALYLVDTNLVTRKNIKPTERAKAYELRLKALKDEKIRTNIDKDILKDLEGTNHMGVREALERENSSSRGSVQRYLRVNYLNEGLQNAVDNNKISLKVAEQLSFLGKREQNMICSLITDENKKITEMQAKQIKEIYKDENQKLTAEVLNNIVSKKKTTELFIKFTQDEILEYFHGDVDKVKIKNMLINLLKISNEEKEPNYNLE